MTEEPVVEPAAESVSEDAFLGGALSVLQPKKGYRAGVDAVLLAGAVPVPVDPAERVLDAGAGVGVVGLCVAARLPEARITLTEREPAFLELARANVRRNGLADRVEVIEADLTAPAVELVARGLKDNSFAHIVSNPPFYAEGTARLPRDRAGAAAHIMPAGALDRWLRTFGRLAALGGTLTMIHRPEALPELLAGLEGRFGALMVQPIHPYEGKPALRVLIRGRKGSRAPLSILPGLALHESSGAFRPEIAAVLRSPASFALPDCAPTSVARRPRLKVAVKSP
jgi:tRNA1(Val) A37 N6-methylase TrmN6